MSANKTQLSQHRKKKYVFKERESPFPVPIASITREDPNQNYWFHYTGQIQGDYVIVTHSGDISYLQRMVSSAYTGKSKALACPAIDYTCIFKRKSNRIQLKNIIIEFYTYQ
jgi:hypothetical protein